MTLTSCTGVEDAGTSFAQTVANGSPLNTSDLVPNQIHTFTVTATNSEGYTSTQYATFITLANPPTITNQTATVQSGQSVTDPLTYTGTYPANLSTEQVVTPPAHGNVTFNPQTGAWTYTNDNSANATDSFSFQVSDTAGNPSDVEIVNLNVQDQVNPTTSVVTPPPDNSGSYAYQSTVDANYSCADNVQVASCTASQMVNGVPTNVPNGSPIDTTSLIVGNTHSLTVTAVDWQGNTSSQTVNYTVNTPGPTANDDTASTINPNAVNIPVLNNDTSNFPLDPVDRDRHVAADLRVDDGGAERLHQVHADLGQYDVDHHGHVPVHRQRHRQPDLEPGDRHRDDLPGAGDHGHQPDGWSSDGREHGHHHRYRIQHGHRRGLRLGLGALHGELQHVDHRNRSGGSRQCAR